MPHQWYGELIHMFYAKLVVDLSPADGKFLTAAIGNRVGYIGICYTEAHCDALMARAKTSILQLMKDPSSKLYSPSFAKAVGAAVEKIPEKPAPARKGRAAAKSSNNKAAAPAGSADPAPPAPGTPVAGNHDDDPDGASAALWDPDAEE